MVAGFAGCSGGNNPNSYFAPLPNSAAAISGNTSNTTLANPAVPTVFPSPTPSTASTTSLPCLSYTASVVGFSNTSLQFSGNAHVQGSVVLFGKSALQLSGNATVVDDVFTGNPGNVTLSGNASVGHIEDMDLTPNEATVLAFAKSAEMLVPTQTFATIAAASGNSDFTVTGNGGVNVIQVTSGIMFSGNQNLVLSGTPNDQFIFILGGSVNFTGNSNIKIVGNIPPRNIVFVVMGANSINLTGNGNLVGTFLAPQGPAMVSGNGTIQGSLFALGDIDISGNGLSFMPAPFCPMLPAQPLL